MGLETAAAIGVGAQAAGSVVSFAQSVKQSRLEEEAIARSKEFMADARKKAEKDLYAGLNVSTEAYDAAFDNNLQAQTQNIQALQEGDARNLAAGLGSVQQSANAGAENTRLLLQKDLEANARMKTDSASAINQDLKRMDLGEAKDFGLRARDAATNSAAAFSQGVSGLAGIGTSSADLIPLFGNREKNAIIAQDALAAKNLEIERLQNMIADIKGSPLGMSYVDSL
tara:strand:+ start:9240 stop:9920 length:681 start_codon:yes stop_codon:yes gene_type:complete